jgi:hypothetical protein
MQKLASMLPSDPLPGLETKCATFVTARVISGRVIPMRHMSDPTASLTGILSILRLSSSVFGDIDTFTRLFGLDGVATG